MSYNSDLTDDEWNILKPLMPYKNVHQIIEAMTALPHLRLVVVGDGPLLQPLRAFAPSNVSVVGRVSDDEIRWLYANCSALVAASLEDFGLTPVEAGLFGKPTACLRYGGFLDTMVEGETGLFFDDPDPGAIAHTIRTVLAATWKSSVITGHAERFGVRGFQSRLRAIVAEEHALVARSATDSVRRREPHRAIESPAAALSSIMSP